MQQVTWTVTQDEYDAMVRAGILRAWLITGLPWILALCATTVLVGSVDPLYFVVFAIAGTLFGCWFGFMTWRSTRRMFGAAYPVGSTVSAEATDDLFVLRSASGAMELPWTRFGRHRVGPVLVMAKDRVSRCWMFIPRPLLPDAWLQRLDPALRRG